MKTLMTVVLLQCVLLNFAEGETMADFHQNSFEDRGVNSKGWNREGRILASYSKNVQDNTAQAVIKLDGILSGAKKVSAEIDKLGSSLNASKSEQLVKLQGIETALSNGSDVVNSLQTVQATASELLDALTNSSRQGTIVNQLSSIYSLLETKLSNVEKILGYDDYPPYPSTTTTTEEPTTTTTTTTTPKPISCASDNDCASTAGTKICSPLNVCVQCMKGADCDYISTGLICLSSVCSKN